MPSMQFLLNEIRLVRMTIVGTIFSPTFSWLVRYLRAHVIHVGFDVFVNEIYIFLLNQTIHLHLFWQFCE